MKMKITGSNLTNICRLLFSISRNSENDLYFMDPQIIGNFCSHARFNKNKISKIFI